MSYCINFLKVISALGSLYHLLDVYFLPVGMNASLHLSFDDLVLILHIRNCD